MTVPDPSSDAAYELLALGVMNDGQSAGLRVVPVGLVGSAGELLYGIGPDGCRHLLVPLAEGEAALRDDASRNISAVERHLPDDSPYAGRVLDLACHEVRLNAWFAKLVDDCLHEIAEVASRGAGQQSSAEVVVACLDKWRELLRAGGGANRPDAAGLLAEMHVVERIAQLDPEKALSLWTGPDRAARDFTGGTGLLEVKAFSTNRPDPVITVHGLGQLEPPADGTPLLLVVESLERVGDGADCIGDCAIRLRDDCGCDEARLCERLIAAGLRAEDLEFGSGWPTQERFRTRALFVYRVDEHFPRIDSGVLAATPAAGRIPAIEYKLDLTTQPPIPLGDAVFDTFLEDLVL